MTNKDLINKIASSTSMTKTHTEEMLSATVAVLQKELLAGKSVQLQGFGALEMQRKSARTVMHPKEGKRWDLGGGGKLPLRPETEISTGFRPVMKQTKST